jgi:glutathione S-transferase
MITLYAAHNYPPFLQGIVRDLRPLWALEELGLPYDFHWLDTQKGSHREAAYKQINPFGKIPAMTDGDLALFESGAMVNYLFDKAGRGAKDDAARAKNLAWCFAAVNTVEPQTFDVLLYDTFWKERPNRDAFRAERVANAALRMNEMNVVLAGRDFLTGSEIAPADIMMTTVVQFARAAPQILADAPHTAAWLERCMSRPAYQRAAALQGSGPKVAA